MTDFKEQLEVFLAILDKHRTDVTAHQAVLVQLIKLLIEREKVRAMLAQVIEREEARD